MKKNKFITICTILVGLQIFSSCEKSFLEVEPKGIFIESNYYQTPEEAFSGLVSAYSQMVNEASGPKLGALNSAADECYTGGGGPTDFESWQVWNTYTLNPAVGPQAGFWNADYAGVYRANLILQKISGGIPGLSDELKIRYIAEAKFLRSYFYFELVRLFNNIPLITLPIETTEIYNITQANPAEVWSQIEKDLTEAIPDLPETVPAEENGRITKGAAIAQLGKVILFQNNENRMAEAAGYFEQVNNSPNYHLMGNYADIFSPDHKFNSEAVLELAHSAAFNADWSSFGLMAGNLLVQMCGPQSYTGPDYWSGGWAFNPIIPEFVASVRNDPRYKYIVANIDSIVNAEPGRSYLPGYMNTGYFMQKWLPLQKYVSQVGTVELNFPHDVIEIRLADTYLMEAEALVRSGTNINKAQSRLDAVRARVGLSSVPATLDNIYEERRLELATEGHRWFDLVRTGRAPLVLAFKGFVANKHEILPIPLNDTRNTKMVQNPGY